MKIALTAVNARYSHSNLALAYLRKAILEAGQDDPHEIEWNINRPMRELLEILEAGDFTHILFSVYIWNSDYISRILPDLRLLLPGVIIVLGGPEAVHRRKYWTGSGDADYIVQGMAEDLVPLLGKLKREKKSELLTLPEKDFRYTLFPYVENDIRRLKGRLIYYEASRGCLFNCSYCLSAREDQNPDYRQPEQILEELSLLRNFEGTVKFVDRTFNAQPAISRMIWQFMIDNPPKGCFHFEIHPLLLTEEDFNLIEQLPPGAAQFEIGIQTTNKTILGEINRRGDWEKEKTAILRLKTMEKFHLHLDQIVGLPGDTPVTAAQSMNDILKIEPDDFQLGFLKILPGTPLAYQAEERGITASTVPPYEVLSTPTFSFREIQGFHKLEALIEVFHNKGYFPLTLSYLAENLGGFYQFFSTLMEWKDLDYDCRRWEYWGKLVREWVSVNLPDKEVEIKDLLRLDWCPQAKAQFYPPFLEYSNPEEIREMKFRGGTYLANTLEGVKKSEINRAIVFIPHGSQKSQFEAVIFATIGGKKRRIEMPSL